MKCTEPCPWTYVIEVGKGKGSYKVKNRFCGVKEQNRASLYYNSLLTHSGYKKRLVRVELDGTRKIIDRVIT